MIDLHGLHVSEAMEVRGAKPISSAQVLEEMVSHRGSDFLVVTGEEHGDASQPSGTGHHSQEGPRLRPTIEKFARAHSLKIHEVGWGQFRLYK